jgi:crotonobetainyl-CoA:carnitine CoA-transferase CaiB-like acyl-CoA transferase
MFEDPHLSASGGLAAVTLPDGTQTQLPTLPVEMDGRRTSSSSMLARPGEHTLEVLEGAGFTPGEVDTLARNGVIA